MPEGHTTHRLAREHRRALKGRPVAVTSPQGRFAAGAERLDGQVLDDVEAYGKHLLYHWGDGAVLHIHLGLVGTFTSHRGVVPAPRAACRLRLAGEGTAFDLAGPMVCEVLDAGQAAAITATLGADPLRRDGTAVRFVHALRRRRSPIAAVLLDQSIVAGVGNAYRAEALFVLGIDPLRSASDLAEDEAHAVWETLRAQLREGLRRGWIVTTGVDTDLDAARWVYRRAGSPCHRCGTPITTQDIGGRALYWCPRCQNGQSRLQIQGDRHTLHS